MENNGAGAEAAPMKNGSNAAQEGSSATQTVKEPTKRWLRYQTWKKIYINTLSVHFNSVFNQIPTFKGDDKATALLADTEEFKKAQNVKVNNDRSLHDVKKQTLVAGKTLYLPAPRDSYALYLKVDVPNDASDKQKKEILRIRDVHQYCTEISLETKVKLDLVIIGSVVVSRNGYRIGCGNGFTDLNIGRLIEIGSITAETVIATMVHDVQVMDNLPPNLFQKYDTPVDLIVTPTEVIRVANRLPRPAGIFWELLSQRRLKLIPSLKLIKESQKKSGKANERKEENTDVEQTINNNRGRCRGPVRRLFRRNRRAVLQTDTEQQPDNNSTQERNVRSNQRYSNNRKCRPTKSEFDQTSSKPQELRKASAGRQKQRRNRPNRIFFCIKLSNITRDVRVKDLKFELRKRKCNPQFITWKGQFGKCFLYFGIRNGGTPSTEDDINKVLKSLSELTLTIPVDGSGAGGNVPGEVEAAQPQQTKTININVELVKFEDKKAASAADGQANGDSNGGGDAGGNTAQID